MSDSEEAKPNPRGVVWLAAAVEGGLVGVAWLAGWLIGVLPLEFFFWSWQEALLGVAATVPMLVMFFLCLRWPIGPLRPIKRFCDQIIRPLLSPCTLLDLAGISLLAGLGEEMLFRGVFQAGFAMWIGNEWIALALASVLFGLCHAITPAYTVLATIMGAYLGWLFLRSASLVGNAGTDSVTSNLLPSVIAHSFYDFTALIVLLRVQRPEIPAQLVNGSGTPDQVD